MVLTYYNIMLILGWTNYIVINITLICSIHEHLNSGSLLMLKIVFISYSDVDVSWTINTFKYVCIEYVNIVHCFVSL